MSSVGGALQRTADQQERRELRKERAGTQVFKYLTTTDHKVIGNLYLITSFVWFLLGGLMALVIRAELWSPGLDVVDNPDQFNDAFARMVKEDVRRFKHLIETGGVARQITPDVDKDRDLPLPCQPKDHRQLLCTDGIAHVIQ